MQPDAAEKSLIIAERLQAVRDEQQRIFRELERLNTAYREAPLFQQSTMQSIADLRSDLSITMLKTDGIGRSLDKLRDEIERTVLVWRTRLRIVVAVLSALGTVLTAVVIALVKSWLGL